MKQGLSRSLSEESKAQAAAAQEPPMFEKLKAAMRDMAHTLGLSNEEKEHAMAGAMSEVAGRGDSVNVAQVAQKNVSNVMGVPPEVLAQAMEAAQGARAVMSGQVAGTHTAIAQPAQGRGAAMGV